MKNIDLLPFFIVSLLINSLIGISSTILVVKHLKNRTFETYFIMILILLPLSWMLRNILELYALLLYEDVEFWHLRDHDLQGDRFAMILNWSPIILYLLASVANTIRWLIYYRNATISRSSFKVESWYKLYSLLIYFFISGWFVIYLTMKLIYNTEAISLSLEITLAIWYFVSAFIMMIVILRFLNMMATYYPTLYQRRSRFIKTFSWTLFVSLLLRGMSLVLSVAISEYEVDRLLLKSNLYFYLSTLYVEALPSGMLNIMLWKHYQMTKPMFDKFGDNTADDTSSDYRFVTAYHKDFRERGDSVQIRVNDYQMLEEEVKIYILWSLF